MTKKAENIFVIIGTFVLMMLCIYVSIHYFISKYQLNIDIIGNVILLCAVSFVAGATIHLFWIKIKEDKYD